MGNVGGREDGEGTSGTKKKGYEVDNEQFNTDPMLHSPPQSPNNDAYQLPFQYPPQIPMFPWLRSAEMIQDQSDLLVQNTNLPWEYNDSGRPLNLQISGVPLPRPGQMSQFQNDPPVQKLMRCKDFDQEEKRAVMITWCFGGKQVAITGSWSNWKTIEPLHSLGKDFIIMKMLPCGVYHYHFIVDELRIYAPNLPCEFDESGNVYNILNLQDFVPEAPESLSEFEPPPSPISSYDNQPLNSGDFSKPPPELPPQLRTKIFEERSFVSRKPKSSRRPSHTLLNHLYKQDGDDGQSMALCSTQRFLQKYVTVVLYKSVHR
ncbi:5'-AMP-activated protein kinase beta-2 subunit protein [Hibiscus syriacus]|uniref:5'-AMP-activated protein kinase beta-2 subunit protein n=2 Tax=Hibiscus syriacus TaxID=106335 RepID=A0A6A2Z1U0_HIBSY|nr:5'-AMP-activated protein kinase beta-2 subunit protein [Hibiscus syriacus]